MSDSRDDGPRVRPRPVTRGSDAPRARPWPVTRGGGAALRSLVGYLTGPTAVGKTEAALLLAERRGWAVLSVDSRQIYRQLDLGTAKPSPRDRERVEHLLVDTLDPGEAVSAGAFRRLAIRAMEGRPADSVLAVGGAGLYWEALIRELHPLPPADPEIRARHQAILETEGVEGLYGRLLRIDSVTAARLSPRDRQRISRALEVAELAGQPMSRLLAGPRPEAGPDLGETPAPSPPVVALMRPRPDLYARIEQRCGQMLEAGLVDEVRALLEAGMPPDAPGLRTVGYREFLPHLLEGVSMEACVEAFVRHSRRYAKRQETWLRNRTPGGRFLDLKEGDAPEQTAARIEQELQAG